MGAIPVATIFPPRIEAFVTRAEIPRWFSIHCKDLLILKDIFIMSSKMCKIKDSHRKSCEDLGLLAVSQLYTHMPVYHCHKLVLLGKYCFKFATSHKKCLQACPPRILMCFSQGSICESLVNKKSKLTKLFNICWKSLLLKSIKSTWFQPTFNNFVNYELSFTRLSGIDPYKNCID